MPNDAAAGPSQSVTMLQFVAENDRSTAVTFTRPLLVAMTMPNDELTVCLDVVCTSLSLPLNTTA